MGKLPTFYVLAKGNLAFSTCTNFNDNKRHSFPQTVLLKTAKSFLLLFSSVSLKSPIIKHPYIGSGWMILPWWTSWHCISEPEFIVNVKCCFRRNRPYFRTDRCIVNTLQEMYAAVTLDYTIFFKTSFLYVVRTQQFAKYHTI